VPLFQHTRRGAELVDPDLSSHDLGHGLLRSRQPLFRIWNLLTRVPHSAHLSQVLVAFSVEFDNEFERRMIEASHPDSLSLVAGTKLIRFVPKDGVSVSDLAAHAFASRDHMRSVLGCLERWRFIVVNADPGSDRSVQSRGDRGSRQLRDGWGSGRGIRGQSLVRPTVNGVKAQELRPPVLELIEQRWLRSS